MAAHHHPRQNSSSFRRMQSPGGTGVDRRHQGQSPPSLPLFSASSDHTTNTTSGSTLSSNSKSGSSSGNHHAPSVASAGTSSGDTNNIEKKQHHRRKLAQDVHNRALCKKALMENDAMVYLDGPQVYTCGNCRTHLTSHDDIISKSFHGRLGRAYLFDQCVNITTGPAEDRILITGLHTVSDIFCKRCQTLVGWTYAKAYEASQKYKEGKYIIEKINLHMEESDYYDVDRPAGERGDKWRVRSMSWGSERSLSVGSYGEASRSMGSHTAGVTASPGGLYHSSRDRSGSAGGSSSYSSSNHRSPQTPNPKSPRSPSDIIYEYRRGD